MQGKGSYGSVYLVGFQDVALGKELGMEGLVSYVAKKCDTVGTNSAWVMMHKELASFAETHCAIVRPIACHNIEAEPLLVYPYWNGRDIFNKVCGDFFTDMTKPEWKAYNDKYYDEGADTDTSPAARSQDILKGLIDTVNSAVRCFAIISDMMKINPMTCSRSIETSSQQKREATNVYKNYLNSGQVNMAYGMAFHQMRQWGLLP
ncbi:hypothetical protein R1sor_017432 [Riccia sorocarpa]|uniref:Uncharacterized protein n=1 Tax=Riccia sorocarpa TaxID=122646 RepID=A0ABD3IAK1_9MARC